MSHYGLHRNRVSITFDESLNMTKQSFKNECDINNILSQFKRTGIIQHITDQQPIYADLPDNLDYQQALHIAQSAGEAFKTLPSAVRRYFQNDPAQLLSALTDPEMTDTLRELGVLAPLNPVEPTPLAPKPPQGRDLLQPTPTLPVAPKPVNVAPSNTAE